MSGGFTPRMGPRLEMRQSQQLVMTPQLMQAIKLLQLSNIELAQAIEEELEKNPLLERVNEGEDGLDETNPAGDRLDHETRDDGPSDQGEESGSELGLQASDGQATNGADMPGGDGEGGSETASSSTEDGLSDPDLVSAGASDISEIDGAIDADLGEVLDETRTHQPEEFGRGGSSSFEDSAYNLEEFVASAENLGDVLEAQASMAFPDPVDRLLATALIGDTDDAGYMRGDLTSIAERMGTNLERAERVLDVMHGFEPTGVMARDLAECLSLQLKERDRFDPAMAILIDHLELLARRDYAALRRLCGVDDEDLVDMVAEIRALEPRPGSQYTSGPVQPVIPDVFVKARSDGGWAIELNTDTLPKLLVNRGFYASTVAATRDGEDKMYLNERLQEATWLVKSLDQRARTILKVSMEIVRQQDAFLAFGIEHLRPLNLKQVAEAIQMHESTISRVTANKYMATPRGLFELKYFFPSAISSSDGGEAHSAESVRRRIKDLVEREGEKVLSDDQIVKTLEAEGVDIARRTVAKYRESLNIPSSVQRRREKRLTA